MNDRAPRSARAGFVRQTLTILLIIAAVELIIMAAFSLLPAMPVVLEAVLDALILSALAAPPIWYLVIRPLRNEVRNRELEVEYHGRNCAHKLPPAIWTDRYCEPWTWLRTSQVH